MFTKKPKLSLEKDSNQIKNNNLMNSNLTKRTSENKKEQPTFATGLPPKISISAVNPPNYEDSENIERVKLENSDAIEESPQEDELQCDDNKSHTCDLLVPKDPTTFMRILYRFFMALIPAILAKCLTQNIIGVVSTAAGF